jgi:hypothetical protein
VKLTAGVGAEHPAVLQASSSYQYSVPSTTAVSVYVQAVDVHTDAATVAYAVVVATVEVRERKTS